MERSTSGQNTYAKESSDDFSKRMGGIVSAGALAPMLSIGHRLFLFDTLARLNKYVTSTELAKEAGNLNERYVREWLSAMACARIVEYDAAKHAFYLPPQHASCLTRASFPKMNVAVMAYFCSVLGLVEDKIVGCFKQGGGTSYGDYGRFHEVMSEDSDQSVVRRLVYDVIPLAPGLKYRLETGMRVLDAGCGAGHSLLTLAYAFPNSTFMGYDLCLDAIKIGQKDVEKKGLGNVELKALDLLKMQHRNDFDLILCLDTIHDYAHPSEMLHCVYEALKPGGTLLVQDVNMSSDLYNNLDNSLGALVYSISTMHCMAVSLGQGGDGLGTAWGTELAMKMMSDAGFKHIKMHHIPDDPMHVFYICDKI